MAYYPNPFQRVALTVKTFLHALLKNGPDPVGADAQSIGRNSHLPGEVSPVVYPGRLIFPVVLQNQFPIMGRQLPDTLLKAFIFSLYPI